MKLSQYAKIVGVSYKTAWTWYRNGEINGYQTPTGTIIVTELDQKYLQGEDSKTVVYARVSINKQKDDLERQIVRAQDFCAANGWRIDQVVKEIASGINDERPKLIKILTDQSVKRIVVEHKDRLTRVGYNYIDVLLQQRGGELVVINLADTDNEDLLQDLASIIYSFCARLYGKRRAKHKADLITKTLEAE
jgi:predicted site-specific integrase-resolvase